MTITLPNWPFVILAWAFVLMLIAASSALTVFLLIRTLKNRKVFRLARIFLTCEKWRKEADTYIYTVLEDCMRAMYKDQPKSFYYMRDRLLSLTVEPLTTESLADDLLRALEVARKLKNMEGMVDALESLEKLARDKSAEWNQENEPS